MNAPMNRVVPLDALDDFKIADGEPDIRGWAVLGSDGRKLGSVHNLLIDTDAMKVRYIAVDIDRELAGGERYVLIPIGYARLDRDEDQIFVEAIESSAVVGLPAYEQNQVTREYETSLRRHFDTEFTPEPAEEQGFYEHEHFDEEQAFAPRREGTDNERHIVLSEEQLTVGKREIALGEVGISKRVETEHVRQTVPVTREEVVIERRPATADMGPEPRFEGDEIHIPIFEEEIIVEKRMVAKEVLVIRKTRVTEEQVVEADLRRERIEIDRDGDVEVREG